MIFAVTEKGVNMKNKHITVEGIQHDLKDISYFKRHFQCLISNDEKGKTLSISNGYQMFTVPFEPLKELLLSDK